MLVASRTPMVDLEAQQKGWPRHEDGHWSNKRRGMFQKGHGIAELRELCASLPDLDDRSTTSLGGNDFAAIVLFRQVEQPDELPSGGHKLP